MFLSHHARRNGMSAFQLRVIAHALACAFAAPVLANPVGPVVVNGTASLSAAGKNLTVTNTPGAILDWRSFSVGSGESVRFVQQSATSQVLNRVTGSDPSQILGALSSNGRVFLINPNGIAFGAGSQVNVAALVASTLPLSNADFLAGTLRFREQAGAGKITNQGTIRSINGGQIYLVASAIDNSGILVAPNGDVVLAAGKSVNLVDARNPEIAVEINAPLNQAVNLGQIIARNVSILAGAIQSSGSINADAAVLGDGGRILLRATDTTQVSGSLSARGGADGGDGGFIDTSAKVVNIAGAHINASAAKGKGGQWLIDPADVVIDTAAATSIQDSLNTGTSTTLATPDGSIRVTGAIEKTLGGDAVLTFNALTGISLEAPVSSTSGKLDLVLNGGSGNTLGSTVALNNGRLTVGAPTLLVGGSIANAHVGATGGAEITVPSNAYVTLDNVTLGANLTVQGNGYLQVPNTLTLDNATVTLNDRYMNLYDGYGSYLNFTGTSALLTTTKDKGTGTGIGTVLMNPHQSGNPSMYSSGSGGLTIDANVVIQAGGTANLDLGNGGVIKNTIDAQTGTINIAGTNWLNQGTLSASTGTLSLGGNWQNQGTLGALSGTLSLGGTWTNPSGRVITVGNGGTVATAGRWSNAGTLAIGDGGTLQLGGNFASADIGTIRRTGTTTTRVTGLWDNSATSMSTPYDIDATGHVGTFTLASGTIQGGVLSASAGSVISVFSPGYYYLPSTLDDVTLRANLILQDSTTVNVPNRLTLDNSTVTLGAYSTLQFTGLTGLLTTTRDRNTGNGTGSILLGSGPATYYGTIGTGTANTALTIDTGMTVNGNGQYGINIDLGNSGIVKGTIDTQTGSMYVVGTNWQNQGSLSASSGTLSLAGSWTNPSGRVITAGNGGTIATAGTWNNAGTLAIGDGGTLQLGGNFTSADIGAIHRSGVTKTSVTGIWDNSATTLVAPYDIDANAHVGAFSLASGTIKGGVISASSGSVITAGPTVYYQPSILDDVTLQANLVLQDSAHLNVPNRLTLDNSTITLRPYSTLQFTSPTGLLTTTRDRNTGNGTGSILLGSGPNAYYGMIGVSTPDNALTIDTAVTVTGTAYNSFIDLGTGGIIKGTIDAQAALTTITGTNWQNQGTLIASAGTLNLGGSWTNPSGRVITAGNGGTIATAGTWNNAGTLSIGDGGALQLGGSFASADIGAIRRSGVTTTSVSGIWDNSASTLVAPYDIDATAHIGAFNLASGTIKGGVISAGNGSVITAGSTAYYQPSTLDDVTLQANLTLLNSAYVNVPNRLTLDNSTITLGPYSTLQFSGPTGLLTTTRDRNTGNGTGSILLGSGPNTYYGTIGARTPNTALTIDTGVTVGGNGYNNTIDLGTGGIIKGTIDAQAALTTITGTNWQNQGTLIASAGTLSLGGSWTNPSGRVITAGNGGTIATAGTWNNAGTLSIGDGGALQLGGSFASADIGAIRRSGVTTTSVTGVWDNSASTLVAPYDIDAAAHIGAFNLASGTIKGGVISAGSGSVITAVPANYYQPSILDDVTLRANLALQDYTTVNVLNRLTLDNSTITPGTYSNLQFTGPTGLLTTTRDQNTGNGIGSILFGSGPNAYYGSIRVGTPGTALTIDTGVTVTSNGQFGSTIDLGTGGIVKGTIDGQAGRTSITGTRWQNQGTIKSSGGDIALSGDHWVNTASGLIQANAGGISIDGLPVNNGTLEVASAATMTTTNHNLINAASGIIRGTGTLDLGVTGTPPVDPSMPWTYQLNTLTNHGTIDPGMGASGTGTLTVLGNLAMASDGKFHVDLGGVTPGLYDQLVVAGQPLNSYYSPNTGYFPTPSALARLDGQLEIAETGNAISGAFFAGKGDTFANLVTVNGGTSGLTGSFASNRIATPTPADVAFTFATSGAPGISDTTTSVTRWASSASGDWAGADNWTRGVPKNNQDAVVRFSAASTSGSGIASVTINSDVATPASLLLDADLTLATGGAFTLPWNLTTISSVVRLAGGTLTNPNALTMNGLLLLESGTIDGAGSLTMAYGGPGLPTDAGLPGTVVKSTPGIVNINQAFGNTTSIRVLDGQLALNGSGIHTGSFDVASGAILNFGGGVQQFADGSVFSNTGSFVRRTESAQLTGNTSGLTIAADSTLDLTAFGFSGSGNLTNLGTIDGNNITLNGLLLNKGIANLSGTTLLAGGFRNSDAGTLHIGPGNITVEGAVSTLAGGSIDLAGGATLTKSGGTLDWAGGTFGGAGTLAFTNGGLIGFSGSGERTLDNANLQFAFTDLNLPSGSLILRNGALTFNTSAAGATVIPVATTLAVYGGTLTNNGPLDIAGVFGLYGGTLAGSGSINMTGGTIDMPATSSVNWTASGALTNSGTLNLSGRTITSAITNTGTINSTGGLLFTQDFTNDGTFSATAGTTTFAGSFVQNSGFTRLGTGVTAPANLAVGGAGFRLNGGTLGGSGTLSGNLAVAGGTLSPGFSPGSLTITGNLDLSASGTTTIELGGLIPGSGFDVINVGGIANLAGVLNVASYGGYVAAAGTTYNFLNFGASSGSFSSINLPTATGMTYSTQGNFSQLAALALPVAPTVVTPPAIAVALPPATTPPAQAPASATELPTLAVLVTPQQAAIVNLARGRDSAVVVDFPAPAITPPKPGTLVGTARPGAGAIDAIDSAAQRTEPSWYLQDDGVVPYFRNLPLASIDKAELSTMLSDRKTYKAQLFAPATALLEANPALADLPPCVQGQEVDSGTCMVNEALQTILLKKMAGDEQPSSGAHASLPAIARKRALVIGLNSYADKRIPQLASALPDAMAIGDAFSSQLGYAVTRLENPTKAQIMQALRRIARDMAPADSVVIYFAGHGDMVEKTGEGYWIPSDARADVPSGWISNADVSRALAQIKARQVAMISDSCYSGTFAREQTVQSGQEHTAANAEAYLRKRTVTVMTSGSDEPVADTGKRGHSVFAWNLMEQIKQLDNWSAGTSVFATVRVEVERALPQSPQYGASLSAGHEAGGDFLFERRDRIQ